MIRQLSRVALVGIVLLPLACKRGAGDGLLSLRLTADGTRPPPVARKLVLSGGGITRTYTGEVQLKTDRGVIFQFPGIPASDTAINFTVGTYDNDGCKVGENAKTITTTIKAGAETGPIDVIMVAAGACSDAGTDDAGMADGDGGLGDVGRDGSGGDGGTAGIGGRSGLGTTGTGGQTASGGAGTGGQTASGGAGTGGQTSSGGTALGGQPSSGGAGTAGQTSSGGTGTGGQTSSGGAGTGGQTSSGGTVIGGQTPSGGTRTGGQTSSGGAGTGGQSTLSQGGGAGTGGAGVGGTTGGTGGAATSTAGGTSGGGVSDTGTGGAVGGTSSLTTTGGGGTTNSTTTGPGGTTGQGGTGGATSGTGGSTTKPGSPGCGKAPTTLTNSPTTATQNTITSLGKSRQFLVRWPDTYDNTTPYRLIIGLHGAMGSDTDIGPSYFDLFPLANNSTIFVAPSAEGGLWNASTDVVLVNDILNLVQAELCIDPSRIMLEGFSQGAAMAWTIACAPNSVFRAVVGHSGGGVTAPGECHGRFAYLGSGGTQEGGATQATQTDRFAEWNTCTISALPTAPTGGHICTGYTGCPSDYPVIWCSYDGGHTAAPRDSGQSSSWMPQAVWDFFSQF